MPAAAGVAAWASGRCSFHAYGIEVPGALPRSIELPGALPRSKGLR